LMFSPNWSVFDLFDVCVLHCWWCCLRFAQSGDKCPGGPTLPFDALLRVLFEQVAVHVLASRPFSVATTGNAHRAHMFSTNEVCVVCHALETAPAATD